jgi:hypothetical protein
LILVAVIGVRWYRGHFGTRLIAKLAMIFALVGVVPGLILYGVSLQFVSRSIETWFDVKVESALNSGLELGRVTLQIAQEEILAEGNFIAEQVVNLISPGASISYGIGNKGWVGDVPKFSYSVEKLRKLGWAPRLGSDQAIALAAKQIAFQERG